MNGSVVIIGNQNRLIGLGLTANGKRNILSGAAYERMFPKSENVDPIINNDGTVNDTVGYCEKIVLATLNDTKQISKLLKRNTLNETCKAIFDFFYKHYQYEIDKPGVEQLRRPSRAWADRKKGIDCDCFSISVSSVLTNLGIPHYFRIVKMYNRDYFQHIYVVVPKSANANMNNRNDYYVIDPVVDKYDLEAPGITKKQDKKMTMQGMPIQYLNGVGSTSLGEEFNGLGDGLGEADYNSLYGDFCRRCKSHLINTRNAIARNPRRVSKFYKVDGLLGAYDELIGAWDNQYTRDAVLEKLSGIEESLLQPQFQGLGDILYGTDAELFGLINADLDGLDGLAGKKSKARRAAGKNPSKMQKKGKFTKLKNAVKKAKGKTKQVLKKIGKKIVKNNPITLAARAGFIVAMKSNAFRIASRVYWAFFTEEQAVKAGVSRSFYKKAQKGLEFVRKIFINRLKGNEDTLKKAIITGRAAKVATHLAKKGKLNGIDSLSGVNGLAAVDPATISAAMTFLTSIAGLLTKIMGNKGNNAKEEAETGAETEPTSSDAKDAFTTTDPGPIIRNDGSERAYVNTVVNQSGGGSPAAAPFVDDSASDEGTSDDESERGGSKTSTTNAARTVSPTTVTTANTSNQNDSTSVSVPPATDDNNGENKGGSSVGLIVGVAALAAVAMAASSSSKPKAKAEPVSGLSGPKKQKITKVKLS